MRVYKKQLKTLFKGVAKRVTVRRGTIYRAVITPGNKAVYGRYRDTIREAAKDYDALARKHYGEKAVLNFP